MLTLCYTTNAKGESNMKIFMSVDMEGIAGTFNWKQETNVRNLVRKCMMDQVSWVIEGIKESSRNSEIDEIVIADSHDGGDSLTYDITALDDRLHLITGSPRPNYMMPDFENGYDIVFLVGYHAGTGAHKGNMDHTYSNGCFHNIWINDIPMNESFVNSAYAGRMGVPVGLIIGDSKLREEIFGENGMPWVEYVVTKKALSKYAVKQRPQNVVKRETIEAVKKCLEKNPKDIPLYIFKKTPIELKIEFQTSSQADIVQRIPYSKRVDGRTVSYSDDDYKIIFETVMAMNGLAVNG